MRAPSIAIVFFTVFIDLIGFGIVLPLLPLFAKNLEASGLTIGILMGTYSAMQFVFAPIWGRLSDRHGRRPILLVSCFGSVIAYSIFAIGCSMQGNVALVILFASRIFAGICGANITVAQAYIADISPPEERSKKMGLIGMAFGLGFIFGPALGALSIRLFGITGPGWTAAAFSLINVVFAYFLLGESWKPSSQPTTRRPHLNQMFHTLGQPGIGVLIGIFFLATLGFTCFETLLPLIVSQNFNLQMDRDRDLEKITYLFAFCGILGALVQGGGIGRAVKSLGEVRLIIFSLIIFAVGIGPIPFARSWTFLLVSLALLSIGSSLTRPPVFGLISLLTPSADQGTTLGVAQSAGSLARILGPVLAGLLYEKNPSWPFIFAASISLVAAVIGIGSLSKLQAVPQPGRS